MLQTLKFYFSFKLVFKTFNSRIVDKNLKTFLILKKKNTNPNQFFGKQKCILNWLVIKII